MRTSNTSMERRRLTGQNALILERLRKGPATNVELAEIALKYTSRISDVRKHLAAVGHGETIECEDIGDGVKRYRIRVRLENMRSDSLFEPPRKKRPAEPKPSSVYDPPPQLHSNTKIPSKPRYRDKCLTGSQWSRLKAWLKENWDGLSGKTAAQILAAAKLGAGNIPICPVRSLDINAIYEAAKSSGLTIYEPESKFMKGK